MKALKKFTMFLSVLVPILSLCGCYTIDAGSMSKLKGTYALTEYYRTYPASGEEASQKTDFIEEKKIEAYLVIDGSSFGYVVYKDEQTAPLCNRVYITYTYSEENPQNVEMIEYRTARSDETPIVERGKLGFYAKAKMLNQTLPRMEFENGSIVTKYTDYTKYVRADKATDLSYVAEKFGSVPACADFALAPYEGLWYLDTPSETEYIYYVMDIDSVAKKATVYYALRADGERVVKTEQNVSRPAEDNGVFAQSVIVGEKRFITNTSANLLTEEIPTEDGYTAYRFYSPLDEDLETYLQQALDQNDAT